MSTPSIRIIENLSANEIERLTQLLSLTSRTVPSLEWLKDQEACMADIPSKLKRPGSLIPRLTMVLPFTQKAHLCKAHKQFNAYLIRRIFLQVSAECTTRLTRLVENPYLPPNLATFVKRLQTTNSLWMSPDLYRVTFRCMPDEERFVRIPTDCEACILAAVGGDHQILSDLRTSMLGRKKKRGPEARLLKLVEEWIEWTGMGNVLRAESDNLARDVRECRRQMQMARRQKRKNLAEGIIEPNDLNTPLLQPDAAVEPYGHNGEAKDCERHEGEERDEHDPEGSIIDFYAHRISSIAPTLNNAQREDSIHPAFRSSLYQSSSSASAHSALPPRPGNPIAYTDSEPSLRGHRGASARQHQPPPLAYNNRKQPRNTTYTESVYSSGVAGKGGICPPSTRQKSNLKWPRKGKSSEEQADEYQGLLNGEKDVPRRQDWEDAEDGDVPGQQRMTSFEDFM